MSRDKLAPPSLSAISERFGTPTNAVTLTGVVMLALIAFVPVTEIAKLASAFQILVFVLVNLAVVAFRASETDYEPTFESPLYPWIQGFGVLGGLVLLTQMGTLPLVGAVVMILGGAAWYVGYARPRVRREGVAADAVRRQLGDRAVAATESAFRDAQAGDILVAVTEETTDDSERVLVDVARRLVRRGDGRVSVVQFDRVPDQTPLDYAEGVRTDADRVFEERTSRLTLDLEPTVEYGEVVSHDPERALTNFATRHGYDLVVTESAAGGGRSRLFHGVASGGASFDLLAVGVESVDDLDSVALVTDSGPFDPTKVRVADALAAGAGASLTFVHGIEPTNFEARSAAVGDYHDSLAELCSVPVSSRVVPREDLAAELAGSEWDLTVVQVDGDRSGRPGWFGRLTRADLPGLVTVYPRASRRSGPLGRLLERAMF